MMEQQQKISLNVHLQVPATTSNDGSHTPNTPEILNTIVNMTSGGPFASEFQSLHQQPTQPMSTMMMMQPQLPIQEQPTLMEQQTYYNNPVSSTSLGNSESLTYTDISMDTTSSNLSSPSTPNSSLSVQAYTSQFIKEGLRIKMRQRLGSGSSTSSIKEAPSPTMPTAPATIKKEKQPRGSGKRGANLTPDDMVRRQRRRERNKIAATKCRNKKKARTMNLMKESEILDTQNKALKSEISKLESEKNHLMDILAQHEPSCAKKLKEAMKQRNPFDCFENEFRVPLPPVDKIPVIKVTGPSSSSSQASEDPPSFAEAIRMVTEVKAEEEEEIPSLVLDQYFQGNSTGSSQEYHYAHQNPFLAKRSLGQTYLDLDSRCIAL